MDFLDYCKLSTLGKMNHWNLRQEWSWRIDGPKDVLEFSYIEFSNNFLTYDRFAEYFHISLKDAYKVINLGREIHERRQSGRYEY